MKMDERRGGLHCLHLTRPAQFLQFQAPCRNGPPPVRVAEDLHHIRGVATPTSPTSPAFPTFVTTSRLARRLSGVRALASAITCSSIDAGCSTNKHPDAEASKISRPRASMRSDTSASLECLVSNIETPVFSSRVGRGVAAILPAQSARRMACSKWPDARLLMRMVSRTRRTEWLHQVFHMSLVACRLEIGKGENGRLLVVPRSSSSPLRGRVHSREMHARSILAGEVKPLLLRTAQSQPQSTCSSPLAHVACSRAAKSTNSTCTLVRPWNVLQCSILIGC